MSTARSLRLFLILGGLAIVSTGGVPAPQIGGPSDDLPVPDPVEIVSLSPTSGAPGRTVTVTGSGFKTPAQVLFRRVIPVSLTESITISSTADATVQSSSQLRFNVPGDVNCSPYEVRVRSGFAPNNPNQIGSFSNSLDFTVTQPCIGIPLIGLIEPRSAFPGNPVIVEGVNFTPESVVTLRLDDPPFTETAINPTFNSSAELEFTVPTDAICSPYFVQVTNPGAVAASNVRPFRVRCPPNANWQLRLERLRAVDVQEEGFGRDGDEPYLVVIGFRSSALVEGSTSTFWNGFLDDAWSDGIDDGGVRDIPAEMGVISFPNVTLEGIVCGEGGCGIEVQVLNVEYLGAVVFVIEHDHTPFGTVRERVESRRAELEETVKKFVEDFGRDAGPTLDLVKDLREPIDLGGFGNWLRSFGNRDDFIDVHLFMFAAVDTNARDARIALLPLAGFFGGATTTALRQRELQAQFGSDSPRYVVTGSLNWATRGFVIDPGRVIMVD